MAHDITGAYVDERRNLDLSYVSAEEKPEGQDEKMKRKEKKGRKNVEAPHTPSNNVSNVMQTRAFT